MEEAPLKPQNPETSDDDDEEEEEKASNSSAFAEAIRARRHEREDAEPDASEESWFDQFNKGSEPAPESEAPAESISPAAEAPAVAVTLAEHERQNIPEHAPDQAGDEETAADLAAADFYDRVVETGDPDAAEAATLDVLESEPMAAAELPAEEEPETIPEEAPEAEAPELVEFDPAAPRELGEEDFIDLQQTAETEPEPAENDDADADSTSSAAHQTLPPVPPPNQPNSTGNVPPNPPVPPTGSGFGGFSGSGPGGPWGPAGGGPAFGGPQIPNFNASPAAAAASPDSRPRYERVDDGASPAAMALFGGIVGYLIGRRRGRIKTEKKLLPIQKKLEKQVTDMHWEMKAKEAKIRQLAREKARQNGQAAVETLAAAAAARQVAKSERPAAEAKVKPLVIKEASEVKGVPSRQRAPEARQLHGSAKTHEQQIGHMLMAGGALPLIAAGGRHELAAPKEIKGNQKNLEENVKRLTETRVETMNRADLLDVSEKIIIDGTSLRQIYESHLVGEHGLRRLVREHLRGGDLKKALRREIVEREIDFERDPALRDKIDPARAGASSGAAAPIGGKDALGRMIERASASLPADSEEKAFYKARANYETQQREIEEKKRQLVDLVFGITIAALAVIAALVYFLR